MIRIIALIIWILVFQMTCYGQENFKLIDINKDFYVIEPIFEVGFTSNFIDGMAKVKYNGKIGYIDKKGRIILSSQFDDISDFNDGTACVQSNGKWGLIDDAGNVLITPIFDQVMYFQGNFARVFVSGQGFGIINRLGEFVVKPQYDNIGGFFDGVASVAVGKKYGAIDTKGSLIVDTQYDELGNFNRGVAIFRKNDKCGLVDITGKTFFEITCENIYPFFDDLAIIKDKQKFGLINRKGELILEPNYDFNVFSTAKFPRPMTLKFSEGLEPVKKDDKWGYIDKTGLFVIEPMFISVSDFVNGKAIAQISQDKEVLIDKLGNVISENISTQERKLHSSENFDNKGISRNKANVDYGYDPNTNKFEVYDKEGNILSEYLVDYFVSLREIPNEVEKDGMITFVKDNKYGFINTQTHKIINPQFEQYEEFQDGIASVGIDGKWGIINKDGEFILKPTYSWILPFKGNLKGFSSRSKWGYLDSNGNVAIEPKFDEIKAFNGGYASVRVDYSWRLIDENGNYVSNYISNWEFIFSEGASFFGSLDGYGGFLVKKAYAPDYKIKVDGYDIEMDVPPVNVDGRLLVPLRAILEKLDTDVSWDSSTKTVLAHRYSDETVELEIDSKIAKVNGKEISLDVPAQIINGRTLIPLRFIAENFGAKVHYDSENNIVNILGVELRYGQK